MHHQSPNQSIVAPADVPPAQQQQFIKNYQAVTRGTGHAFFFVVDHKLEHLNDDFYGTGIAREANDPKHIFDIAQTIGAGALATHMGLIAQYAQSYRNINYIVKLTGKTNAARPRWWHTTPDPLSAPLWTVDQVVTLREQTKLPICGIGITVYVGSAQETAMLSYAAQEIFRAHQAGLVAVVWLYLRGTTITHPYDGQRIVGLCGIAATVGADFVKIHAPHASGGMDTAAWLSLATQAAGKTKVVVSGGSMDNETKLLERIHDHIHKGKVAGCAIGRNLIQRPLPKAIALGKAIAAITYEQATVETAKKLL